MKKAKIKSINIKFLEEGRYKKLLPEIYELDKTIENNLWHKECTVFEHTIQVMKNLEEALKLKWFNEQQKLEICKTLKSRIDLHTKKDLLKLAALLHDIGKAASLLKDSEGNTRYPAHEIFGANIAPDFSVRFNLSKKEESYIKRIIEYHGLIVDVQNQIMEKGKKKYYFDLFKKIVGDVLLELLLLFYSDLLASDLKETKPNEFKNREKLTKQHLLKYL